MEELHRVDIKLSKEILRLAGIRAAEQGISRRQYIANAATRWIMINPDRNVKITLNPFANECIEPKSE